MDSSAYRSIWPLAGVAKGRSIEEGRIHRSSRPSRQRGSREIDCSQKCGTWRAPMRLRPCRAPLMMSSQATTPADVMTGGRDRRPHSSSSSESLRNPLDDRSAQTHIPKMKTAGGSIAEQQAERAAGMSQMAEHYRCQGHPRTRSWP